MGNNTKGRNRNRGETRKLEQISEAIADIEETLHYIADENRKLRKAVEELYRQNLKYVRQRRDKS